MTKILEEVEAQLQKAVGEIVDRRLEKFRGRLNAELGVDAHTRKAEIDALVESQREVITQRTYGDIIQNLVDQALRDDVFL